ncbi:hypothetical protein R0J87_24865, partial [Halomonas sp. SIMBA_159]
MPAETEDNLDDVISDLIDGDEEEEEQAPASASPLADIDTPEIDFDGPDVALTERAARQVRKIRE